MPASLWRYKTTVLGCAYQCKPANPKPILFFLFVCFSDCHTHLGSHHCRKTFLALQCSPKQPASQSESESPASLLPSCNATIRVPAHASTVTLVPDLCWLRPLFPCTHGGCYALYCQGTVSITPFFMIVFYVSICLSKSN